MILKRIKQTEKIWRERCSPSENNIKEKYRRLKILRKNRNYHYKENMKLSTGNYKIIMRKLWIKRQFKLKKMPLKLLKK